MIWAFSASGVRAATYIADQLTGSLLLPHSPSLQRLGIQDALAQAGVDLLDTVLGQVAAGQVPSAAQSGAGASYHSAADAAAGLPAAQRFMPAGVGWTP